ncbi:MAG: hypothetical protein HYU63_03805, partial [Armatimonadetes bacterium]|nr:hypothetical protein [Armatimonadota bacterium]
RILYASPLTGKYTRTTKNTSVIRNNFVVENADKIFIAYAVYGGQTEALAHFAIKKGKKIYTFDVPENRNLLELGALNESNFREKLYDK